MIEIAFQYDLNSKNWVKCKKYEFIHEEIEKLPTVVTIGYRRENQIEDSVMFCPIHKENEKIKYAANDYIESVSGCRFEGIIGYGIFDGNHRAYGIENTYAPFRWRIFQN